MKTIDWSLCLVADAEAAKRRDILPFVKEAVKAGATLVQLRGKKLKTQEFLELALKTSEFLKTKNTPLIINDRIDIALSCQAAGIHLGQEDLPLPYARKIVGQNKLIGVTVNTVKEAEEAEKEGANYLGAGPVYFTPTKKELGPLLGLPGLKAIREKTKIPILAIGGINPTNAREVITSGVDGVAVMSAIMEADDISKATRELLNKIKQSQTPKPG